MSSNVQHVEFAASDLRILQRMLKHASYLTANLRPLEGPLFFRSSKVLRRFLTTVVQVPAE